MRMVSIVTPTGLKVIGNVAIAWGVFNILSAYSMLFNHSYEEFAEHYLRTSRMGHMTLMTLVGVIAMIAGRCLEKIEKRLDKLDGSDSE